MDAMDRQELFDALASVDPLAIKMIHDLDGVQKIDDDGNFVNDPVTWPVLYKNLAEKYDVHYVRPDVAAKMHLSAAPATVH